MRYDNATFMDMLYKMLDMAEDSGGAIFDELDQELKVIKKLKEIECLMQN